MGKGLFRLEEARRDLIGRLKGQDLSKEERELWQSLVLFFCSERMFRSRSRLGQELLGRVDDFWEVFSFGPESLRRYLERQTSYSFKWSESKKELLLRLTAFHLENELKRRGQGKRDQEKFDRELREMMGLWRELIPEVEEERRRFLKERHLKEAMANFWKELLGNTEAPAAIRMAREYFPDVFGEAHGHGEC